MNIKQAKEEILLLGSPGIGKTQIMEQIARECEIGLVAYTITHHTRQSAVGLPFIKEEQYGGKTYSVTEYTMSEIIASVYRKIEESGRKEGILFIGADHAAIFAVQNVWQSGSPGGMDHCCSRKSAGVQQVGKRF